MKFILLGLLLSFNAVAQEKVCVRYENIEVEECTNSTLRNAAGGALVGGLLGYAFKSKKGAISGSLLGAAGGAMTGERKCTRKVEKQCVEYKEFSEIHKM